MDCDVRRYDGRVRLCFVIDHCRCLLWLLQLPVRGLRQSLLPTRQPVRPLWSVELLDGQLLWPCSLQRLRPL
jgi:hypothetical protein